MMLSFLENVIFISEKDKLIAEYLNVNIFTKN